MINIRDVREQSVLDWATIVFRRSAGINTNFDLEKIAMKAVDRDGKDLLAVIVISDLVDGERLEMSVASVDPTFLTKKVLFDCFNFCFNICGVKRIYTQVIGENEKALEFNKRLGFKEIVVLPEYTRNAAGEMKDNHVFIMAKNECRWI